MKVEKNQLCPCGSGKKYKNCCFKKTTSGYALDLKGKKAERFVYELSQKSFFTDWCYKSPKLPNNKEICDLLVVYDDVAIIWQIKDLKLDEKGKYSEKEVSRNLQQLCTAKHRLFKLNITIELENPRRGREKFNPKQVKDIFLISALLGKGEDYFSLIEMRKGSIIHTFTRQFTEIALSELDTIKDFILYLREKERLISMNSELMLLGGEEELLAYYLRNERKFEKLGKMDLSVIDEGLWEELQKHHQYIAKKKEDEISYGWDSIIDFAHTAGGEYEKVAREMARLNRFERRVMSKAFYSAHLMAHNETVKNSFRRVIFREGTTYCFLFYDDPEPRNKRRAILGAICFVARGLFPKNSKVLGIATEMKIRPRCSYDFCLLEIPKWTITQQKEMKRLQSEYGLFKNYKTRHAHEDEYPEV